jgi:hypothetical protein
VRCVFIAVAFLTSCRGGPPAPSQPSDASVSAPHDAPIAADAPIDGSVDATDETDGRSPHPWLGTWSASMTYYESPGGDLGFGGDNGVRGRDVTMSVDVDGNATLVIEHYPVRSGFGRAGPATKCTMRAKLREGMLVERSSGCRAMFALPPRTIVELAGPCLLRFTDPASPSGTMIFQLRKRDCASPSNAHK